MKKLLTILLLVFLTSACATTSEGGGTVVSNPPTLPSESLSPGFSDNIFEEAITPEDSQTSFASFLTNSSEPHYLNGSADQWNETFANGPVSRARIMRTNFESVAQRIARVLSQDSQFSLSTRPWSFNLSDVALIDGSSANVRVSVSLRTETLVKVVIRKLSDGKVIGYYLFEIENEEVTRGVFAFVNPSTLQFNASGVRLFALAFNFSDPDSNKLSLVTDAYDSDLGYFTVHHMNYECSETSRNCVAELLSIESNPPNRDFSSRSVRLSWNDDSFSVCLASLSYDSEAHLGSTQNFTGPNEPGSDTDISTGNCSVQTPFWSSTLFSADSLPNRFEDDDNGGFAGALAESDTEETSWENLIGSDTADDWALGVFQ